MAQHSERVWNCNALDAPTSRTHQARTGDQIEKPPKGPIYALLFIAASDLLGSGSSGGESIKERNSGIDDCFSLGQR